MSAARPTREVRVSLRPSVRDYVLQEAEESGLSVTDFVNRVLETCKMIKKGKTDPPLLFSSTKPQNVTDKTEDVQEEPEDVQEEPEDRGSADEEELAEMWDDI